MGRCLVGVGVEVMIGVVKKRQEILLRFGAVGRCRQLVGERRWEEWISGRWKGRFRLEAADLRLNVPNCGVDGRDGFNLGTVERTVRPSLGERLNDGDCVFST